MRKMAVSCLIVLLILPTFVWSQVHQVASQRAVALAMINPWPRLPTPGEVTQAYGEFKAKLGQNVTITSGPSRMNVPWEKDPLRANKVVLTTRADYKSGPSESKAVVLRYDFPSNRFKFEGVMLQGITRYEGDKSTMSFLEPQDLAYLGKDWISSSGTVRKTATPDDVIYFVEEYIRQFENTCFGRVVKLGNPAMYRQALSQRLTVISPSSELGKDVKASLAEFKTSWAVTPPPNELHVSSDVHSGLIGRKLDYSRKQSLYHEATHHIESLHGSKKDRTDPTAERNTGYLDEVANALLGWQPWESQLIKGNWSADAQDEYRKLEKVLLDAEKKNKPELRNLENWAGIRIQIEEIRKLYLSGACGDSLRRVAENRVPGTPAAQPKIDAAGGSGPNSPQQTPPASNTAVADHIVYTKIYDKSSGSPVGGAAFIVLRPGNTTEQWISSNFDPRLIASQGVSDKSGMVVLSQNLQRGKTYSFMVTHSSYKTVRYEALKITATSPEPLKITVNLTR